VSGEKELIYEGPEIGIQLTAEKVEAQQGRLLARIAAVCVALDELSAEILLLSERMTEFARELERAADGDSYACEGCEDEEVCGDQPFAEGCSKRGDSSLRSE